MKKIIRFLLWKVFLYVAVPLGLIGSGYGWWAMSRLDAKLKGSEVKDYSRRYELVLPQASQVKTSLPRVLRVRVKRSDGQNWFPSPSGDLIHATCDWDPARNEWIEVAPSPDALLKAANLRRLQVYTVPKLIDVLSDKDPEARQVAITELHLRTQQDFGYRYDLPPEKQADAIEKWRSWWEAHKVEYGVGKVLDAVEGVIK